jgi:hypothetical protein
MVSASDAHDPKDRFETLCHVAADVSAAPSKLKFGESGKVCYYREYDVVLLVGLTELKAQIRWTDATTVRIHNLGHLPFLTASSRIQGLEERCFLAFYLFCRTLN